MRKLLPLLLIFTTAACRRSEVRVVGVVPKGANHIFWQTVHAGAIKAGREFHFEISGMPPPSRSIPAARSKSWSR